jgi:hypothetical protein
MKSTILLLPQVLILALAVTAAAQGAGDGDTLRFGLGLYGWYADVSGDSAGGGKTEVEAEDLVKNLKMGFMGLFEAQKGKWSLLADVIYIDVGDDGDIAEGLEAEVELTNWVVTPMVAYRIWENDRLSVNALAGARYLSIKADVGLNSRAPLPEGRRDVSESGGNWDGILGLRGHAKLGGKWYLPYHLDIGAGDAKLTWQGMAAIGYSFSRIDVAAGYRYLEWDFDDRPIFDNLAIHGPFAGIKFWF